MKVFAVLGATLAVICLASVSSISPSNAATADSKPSYSIPKSATCTVRCENNYWAERAECDMDNWERPNNAGLAICNAIAVANYQRCTTDCRRDVQPY
jgi:hypothetical protein